MSSRHSRESGNPLGPPGGWIPAFAGVTRDVQQRTRQSHYGRPSLLEPCPSIDLGGPHDGICLPRVGPNEIDNAVSRRANLRGMAICLPLWPADGAVEPDPPILEAPPGQGRVTADPAPRPLTHGHHPPPSEARPDEGGLRETRARPGWHHPQHPLPRPAGHAEGSHSSDGGSSSRSVVEMGSASPDGLHGSFWQQDRQGLIDLGEEYLRSRHELLVCHGQPVARLKNELALWRQAYGLPNWTWSSQMVG